MKSQKWWRVTFGNSHTATINSITVAVHYSHTWIHFDDYLHVYFYEYTPLINVIQIFNNMFRVMRQSADLCTNRWVFLKKFLSYWVVCSTIIKYHKMSGTYSQIISRWAVCFNRSFRFKLQYTLFSGFIRNVLNKILHSYYNQHNSIWI